MHSPPNNASLPPKRLDIRETPLAGERAKDLRQTLSPPERLLWSRLKNQQLQGLRFRRQHPLGPWIADFYCHEAALVVEVDGAGHLHRDRGTMDRARDAWMTERNVSVLRFAAADVFEDLSIILRSIARCAEERMSELGRTTPPPSDSKTRLTPPPLGAGEEQEKTPPPSLAKPRDTSPAGSGGGAKTPRAEPHLHLPDVPREKIPRHIAVIMDGNGRWAQERGFPRIFGHRNGAAAVRTAIETCLRLGVEVLTVYSFSLENWKRPPEEVQALMDLCVMYLDGEAEHLKREGVRVRTIGRREGLPQGVLDAIDRITTATSECRDLTLCIAINYGSRAEIADAAKALARDAAAGKIDPESIDEAVLASRLNTAGLPDPDLLIRTAGELRISNYLLWQISYSEIYVTEKYWPDFDAAAMREAIRNYAGRSRRFGGLDSASA